jgi:hypothetical protein
MATVEETIRQSFTFYPGLLPSRIQMLHYYLCLPNSNYDWLNGELVRGEIYDSMNVVPWSEEEERRKFEEKIALDRQNSSSSFAHGAYVKIKRTMLEQEITERKYVLSHLDDILAQKYDPATDPIFDGPYKFYRQSPDSALMNMPDDVTDDWRAVCDEMRAIAVNHGWKF